MRWLLCISAASLVACASAEDMKQQGGTSPDARLGGGGGGGGQMDAPGSSPDAASGSGSGSGSACTSADLLKNGAFDATPTGTMWTATPVSTDPIITAGSTPAPQSGANIAWMGGYAKAAPNTDSLTQDIAVPATATALTFTGYYYVETEELFGTYDTATISLTTTGGTQIEAIKSLSNNDAPSGFTAFNHTFTNLSQIKGQTVRLKLTTNSDSSYRTNFMFDTFALNVTPCP